MKKPYYPHSKKLIALIVILSLHICALAQCDQRMLTDSAEILFNGPVNKMVAGTRSIYAGGDFSLVGKWTGALAQLDRNTGRPMLSAHWPRAVGKVNGCIRDPSGNTIVFGSFTKFGDSFRTNIGSFDPSWQVTPLNATVNGDINTAAIANGILYIGGYFTMVNGITRNRLAAIDLSTGSLTSWNPNITNAGALPCRIECILVNGSNLHIGGAFSNVASTPRRNIASVDLNTGTPTAWAPEAYFATAPTYGTVTKMLKVNNQLFICGQFDVAGGQSRPDAAAIDLTTGYAGSWIPNFNSVVYSFANKGDTLYVGGIFSQAASLPRQSFAAYSISTGNLLPIVINTQKKIVDAVYDILLSGDTLFLAGTFDTIAGQFRKNIASFNRLTGSILPFDGHAGGVVTNLNMFDGRLHAGGNFTSAGMKPRLNLAEIDRDADTVTTFIIPVNGPVKGLAVKNNTLYISGDFTKVKDSMRQYNAAIDIASRRVTAWDIKADNTFNDMEFYKNDVYIGGGFTKINGVSRNGLAKLDVAGNVQPWTSTAGNGGVNVMEMYNDTLYVASNSTLSGINLITGVATPILINDGVTTSGAEAMCRSDSLLVACIFGGQRHSVLKVYNMRTRKAHNWYTAPIYETTVLFDDRVYEMIARSKEIYFVGAFYNVTFTRHDTTLPQPKPVYQFDTARAGTFLVVLPSPGAPSVVPTADPFNPKLSFIPAYTISLLGNKLYMGGQIMNDARGYNRAALFLLPNSVLDADAVTDTNSLCAGGNITVSTQSTITYGTVYTWFVNGSAISNVLPYYTFKPANKDSISCVLIVPPNGCTLTQYDTTNSIVFNVTPTVTPTISIAGPAEEDSGKQITVKATVLNAADHYTIEWFNKGVSMGKTTVDSISYIKGIGTDSIYAVITPRTDTCYVTDTSGMIYINEKPEGISNVDGDAGITVYPNPFDKFVRIRGLQEGDVLVLYDVVGRKIFADEYKAQTREYVISSGYLKTGTYVLKIMNTHGAPRKNILIQKQ